MYAVSDARNQVAQAGHSRKAEKLMAGMQPIVAHNGTFGWKIWFLVPEKSRNTCESMALTGTLFH